MIPHLLPYWSGSARCYIEPFAGSACFFFATAPDRAILGDLNSELIEAYVVIRDTPREVYEQVYSIKPGRDSYYALREADILNMSAVDRTARFLFLNRFCFNGLYRTNLGGKFNVPFAPAKTGQLPSWSEFELASRMLRNARLVDWDFEETAELAAPGDFVYLDPPYFTRSRRVFAQYNGASFEAADLARLIALVARLSARGVKFVLSYGACPEIEAAMADWNVSSVRTTRNIAGFAKYRRVDTEYLLSNIDTLG